MCKREFGGGIIRGYKKTRLSSSNIPYLNATICPAFWTKNRVTLYPRPVLLPVIKTCFNTSLGFFFGLGAELFQRVFVLRSIYVLPFLFFSSVVHCPFKPLMKGVWAGLLLITKGAIFSPIAGWHFLVLLSAFTPSELSILVLYSRSHVY